MSKKSLTTKKKRQTAAAHRIAERVATVRRKASLSADGDAEISYWHGGWPGLDPGTILVGATEAEQQGIDPSRYMGTEINGEPTPYDSEKVYFSSRRDFARAFASRTRIADETTGIVFQRGALYRVEPIGKVELDPDFPTGKVSWCAPRARIISVEDPNVMMDSYAATQHTGPYMTWEDGSPVYSERGEYLLSPEQIRSGQTQTKIASMLLWMPPWTPVDFVNAALTGKSSHDRAHAEDHAEIALEGDEAVTVLLRHFVRASKLMADGIKFSSAYLPVRDQINTLIAPAELPENDPRGVVFAMHPQDGVVGACVVTAADMGDDEDHMVMMIDKLAVTPSWQHNGLGSVLLTTIQQLLPRPVDFAAGHCDVTVAPFFAQMGFTVLNPSVPMAFPVRKFEKDLQPVQFPGSCCFYRQGRA